MSTATRSARPAATAAPIIEIYREHIEPDEFEASDYDSVSSIGSATPLQPNIYQQHCFENGRRYHQYRHGRYLILNDDDQQNREDMEHAMILVLMNGALFISPIGDSPKKIIDLGTGTGYWAMEVADRYPSTEVIGVDLSPIQPNWVPANCKFLVDDIEDEWLHGDDFDLVHLRSMCPVIKDNLKVAKAAYQHIRPGGWVECQEFCGILECDDSTMKQSCGFNRFIHLFAKSLAKFDMDWEAGNHVGSVFEKAGFINVSVKNYKVPIGAWARDPTLRLAGIYLMQNFEALMHVAKAKPLFALGLSEPEVDELIAKARQGLNDLSQHRYINFKIWTGQKPEKAKDVA